MKLYIGIDNGLKGGITVINQKGRIIESTPMPTKNNKYDFKGVVELLKLYAKSKDCFVILEEAHPRPISGKRACFMNGFGYGSIMGILEALDFKYITITPAKWMRDLGLSSKDKKGSIEYCLDKYPSHSWKATERCTTVHDGKTDSCCIAIWGRDYGVDRI